MKKTGTKIHVRAGDAYGRLVVIEEVAPDRYRRIQCMCSCGKIKTVSLKGLRNGMIRSCGCLQRERTQDVHRIHSLTEGHKHPLYLVWRGMKTRCYNPNCRAFKTYGARGIKICEEWRNDPEAFVRWALLHGWQRGLTINRDNNDRDYEPSNCSFITKPDNNRHRHAAWRRQRMNERMISALSFGV
jgi:hypothetical protein